MDNEWEKLLRKCGEPSEADWQEYLQAKAACSDRSSHQAKTPRAGAP